MLSGELGDLKECDGQKEEEEAVAVVGNGMLERRTRERISLLQVWKEITRKLSQKSW